jgi:hypothetical protein
MATNRFSFLKKILKTGDSSDEQSAEPPGEGSSNSAAELPAEPVEAPVEPAEPVAEPVEAPVEPAEPVAEPVEAQKRLKELGDRVKQNPEDEEAITELVAFLANPDSTLRWGASSALKILANRSVIVALADFLSRNPAGAARWEALKILGVIAGTSKDGGVQDSARHLLSRY